MDEVEHPFAVRLYAGAVSLDRVTTLNGKSFHLLSLPYFLTSSLPTYLDWMMDQV